MTRTVRSLSGFVLGAGPAVALASALAASGAGSARLQIIRPLTVSLSAGLQFGRVNPTGQGGTVTVAPALPGVRTAQGAVLLNGDPISPAVYAITGEPGRAYRVQLTDSVTSTPGVHPVGGFTLASRTAGGLTATRQGQLDANGTDTLYVGATLTLPKGARQQVFTAAVPLSISYE